MLPLNQVICGDNVAVLSGFPDACIDLVVTSPPYDNLRTYHGYSWDFPALAAQLTRVLKPGGVIVWVVADATVNGSETLSSMRQAIHFKDVCGLNVHDTMVYQTSKPPMNDRRYQAAWEYMFVVSKGEPKTWNPIKMPTKHAGKKVGGTYWNTDGTMKPRHGRNPVAEESVRENVWRIVERPGNGHPAPFPESLAKDHVTTWSNPGDVVLDPFNGSGTTCKAAKELNRHFIGIEISPAYCQIANTRLQQEVLQLESP